MTMRATPVIHSCAFTALACLACLHGGCDRGGSVSKPATGQVPPPSAPEGDKAPSDDGPMPAQPAQPAQPPAQAEDRVAKGDSVERGAAPGDAPAVTEEDLAPNLPAHMHDHFTMVSQVRDAVIRGQLAEAEAPLTWLAQHTYAGEVPAAWQPFIDAMQATARQASAATSVSALGTHVAQLAGACGECHKVLGQAVTFEPAGFEPLLAEPASEDVRQRMHRHLWAAERMWEALVAPAPKRFAAAAEVLSDAGALTGAKAHMRAATEAVLALGKRAGHAKSPQARIALYGAFIGQCAGCHREHGVAPGVSAVESGKGSRGGR